MCLTTTTIRSAESDNNLSTYTKTTVAKHIVHTHNNNKQMAPFNVPTYNEVSVRTKALVATSKKRLHLLLRQSELSFF